jgi:hypothetical protein
MLLRWAVLLVQLTTLDATKLTSWGKKNCMAAGTFHVICGHSFTKTKERRAPRGEQYCIMRCRGHTGTVWRALASTIAGTRRPHQTRAAHRTRCSVPVRWGVTSQPQPRRRQVCVITFVHANQQNYCYFFLRGFHGYMFAKSLA